MEKIVSLKYIITYGDLRTFANTNYFARNKNVVDAENGIKEGVIKFTQPLLYISVVRLESGSKSYDKGEDSSLETAKSPAFILDCAQELITKRKVCTKQCNSR